MPGRARSIAEAETLFADAWEAHNRAEIAAIVRADAPAEVARARERERTALSAASDAVEDLDALPAGGRDPDDRRAIEAMRETLGLLASGDPALAVAVETSPGGVADDRPAEAVLETDGLAALLLRTTAAYAAAAEAVDLDGGTLDRVDVLARLATEPDARMRRRLFLALEPVWRSVDGDGGPASPYRVALRARAEAWRRDGSPVDANARALGIDPSSVEPWLRTILETWREAGVTGPIEPWDERYAIGGFARSYPDELSLAELRRINDACYAALGADPARLGIRYDIEPRSGRGPVPVAFMLDVDIPRRTPAGWTPGEQWVLAAYGQPRVSDLGELLHETGHAIHSRAIRTRPAFAVLCEAHTTFIEALGDLVAWDLHEPAWQTARLGRAVPLDVGLRARYGDVVRDVAWSLFEIELHRAPDRAPNEVWTEITSSYLGVVPHPEWSWWAVRGQLVQSPGYMVNYGLGAIVTADLRARLRELRGDWLTGDPGWYDAVSEAIYRWGGEREPGDVLAALLGRPVAPDALLEDLRRLSGDGSGGPEGRPT
jgi:hypothetical protein